MAVSPETRRQLAQFASQRGKRRLDQPRKWQPYAVMNPATGTLFSEPGAWDFIADCLADQAIPLVEEPQDDPPGCVAYVMVVPISTVGDRLYIKLRLGHGFILGRSFHYAER